MTSEHASQNLERALRSFQTIPLSSLTWDGIARSRLDHKFLVPNIRMPEILRFLQHGYLCAESDGDLTYEYHNTYFDTADYRLFQAHRQGKLNRIKIRRRHYRNGSNTIFAELKVKESGTVTKKYRRELQENEAFPFNEFEEFLTRYGVARHGLAREALTQETHIGFTRAHLVTRDHHRLQRITIDSNLTAWQTGGRKISILPDHFILEVKSGIPPRGALPPRDIIAFLQREFGIRETSFSKYCVSLCILEPNLKRNLWKTILKRYARLY